MFNQVPSPKFISIINLISRVWKTEFWEAEAWCTVGGDVVAGVWSPLPQAVLLFATRTQPFLYAIPSPHSALYPAQNDARTASLVIADLTAVQLSSGDM